ncbi:MAG: hypothetical protein DMG97_07600 [Acidobacteria bacterium]|nr:MAG: hypothetical protein DMG97_07600 [Acidobacteriota bacterium]
MHLTSVRLHALGQHQKDIFIGASDIPLLGRATFTISGRTYEVCLRFGKEFAYLRADLGYRTLGRLR